MSLELFRFELKAANTFTVVYGIFPSNDSHRINYLTTDSLTGSMGAVFIKGLPNSSVSCFHYQLVWQGFPHSAPSPIFISSLQSKADISRLHRLSQHWQIFYHKHLKEEESLHGCPHTRRDKSLAIHHPHEANIPYRLPGCRSSQHYRYSTRHSSPWSRPS